MLDRFCLGKMAVLCSLAGCATEVDVSSGPPAISGILAVPDDSWYLLPAGCGPAPEEIPILPELAREIPTDRPWLELRFENVEVTGCSHPKAYLCIHNMGNEDVRISDDYDVRLLFTCYVFDSRGYPVMAEGPGTQSQSGRLFSSTLGRSALIHPGASREWTKSLTHQFGLCWPPGEYSAQVSVKVSQGEYGSSTALKLVSDFVTFRVTAKSE